MKAECNAASFRLNEEATAAPRDHQYRKVKPACALIGDEKQLWHKLVLQGAADLQRF